MPTPRRPNKKTVAKVIKWLHDELGVRTYGQYIDLDSGQMFGGCMDYDAEDIEKLHRLQQRDALWEREEDRP